MQISKLCVVLIATAALAILSTPVDARENWPQFRGPTRDGIVQNTSLLRDWKQNPPKQLWKHEVGPAWSSFAIVENLAFTQEQWREEEAVCRHRQDSGAERPKPIGYALWHRN